MLALLVCCIGSTFAADRDTGEYRTWVTAIGAPFYQVAIDGVPLGAVHLVGDWDVLIEVHAPDYHDITVDLLDFDQTTVLGSMTRYNVYITIDEIKFVGFNFDSHWIR